MPIVDAIGNRLDHPELVPPEFQHLIPDDLMRVETILSIPVKGQILDVGCSDGAITRRIAERPGVSILGVDLPPVTWRDWRCSAHDMREPFPSPFAGPFDALFCCEVLEHMTDADIVKAWANLLAVLSPTGKLIISVPNRDCADVFTAGCRDRWRWPDHRSVWTVSRLSNLLHSSFLRVEWHSKADDIWLMAVGEGKR